MRWGRPIVARTRAHVNPVGPAERIASYPGRSRLLPGDPAGGLSAVHVLSDGANYSPMKCFFVIPCKVGFLETTLQGATGRFSSKNSPEAKAGIRCSQRRLLLNLKGTCPPPFSPRRRGVREVGAFSPPGEGHTPACLRADRGYPRFLRRSIPRSRLPG